MRGSDHIGIVDTKCNPGKICEEAPWHHGLADSFHSVEQENPLIVSPLQRRQRLSKQCMPTQSIAGLALRVPIGGVDGDVETNLQRSARRGHDDLKVEVHCHSESGSEEAIAFSYIPKYLFYIVQERSLLIMLNMLITLIIDWVGLHVHSWLLSITEFTVVELQKLQTPCRS